jgi:hypothetical protein
MGVGHQETSVVLSTIVRVWRTVLVLDAAYPQSVTRVMLKPIVFGRSDLQLTAQAFARRPATASSE